MMRITCFLIPFVICFNACLSTTDLKSYTVIEGRIHDKQDGYFYLIKSENSLDYNNYYEALDSFKIDSKGGFSITIELNSADFFQIRKPNGWTLFSNKDLYLKPNDTLKIFAPKKHIDPIVLKGSAAFLNQIQWDQHL